MGPAHEGVVCSQEWHQIGPAMAVSADPNILGWQVGQP